MLINNIKKQIIIAMRSGDPVERDILRLVVGESQTQNKFDDDSVYRVIKKLIESNKQTAQKFTERDGAEALEQVNKLCQENGVLYELLPSTLSAQEIKKRLVDSSSTILFEIGEAKSNGQATGLAMKFLKQAGCNVDGSDVSNVVKELRDGQV